jgi:general stress protein 26
MKFLALPMDLPRRRVFYEPEHSFAAEEFLMAEIKSDYVKPLENALEDGTPCVLGTVSADNKPEISPKGSIIVYDSGHLAFWERSHRAAAGNIASNAQVVVYYRNPEHAESLPQGGALRLYGTASVIEDAAVTTDVYDRMCEREQKADSGRKGHAVMIAIDRITNLRGDDV